jgi:hypothetical protein
MTAMYGLYADPWAAQRACTALRRAGVPEADITVISAEPFEALEFSRRDRSPVLFRLASLGGVIGLVAGALLARGTETAWPLETAGMPIVSWWPNLIVVFELTMLGAILTTVIALLVTARLPRFGPRLYDPEVSDGKILVGVELAGHRPAEAVRRVLDVAGTVAIRTMEIRR